MSTSSTLAEIAKAIAGRGWTVVLYNEPTGWIAAAIDAGEHAQASSPPHNKPDRAVRDLAAALNDQHGYTIRVHSPGYGAQPPEILARIEHAQRKWPVAFQLNDGSWHHGRLLYTPIPGIAPADSFCRVVRDTDGRKFSVSPQLVELLPRDDQPVPEGAAS